MVAKIFIIVTKEEQEIPVIAKDFADVEESFKEFNIKSIELIENEAIISNKVKHRIKSE